LISLADIDPLIYGFFYHAVNLLLKNYFLCFMTSKKVIFIFTKAYGHLIKTAMIADFYERSGYKVKYFVKGENKAFFTAHPFTNELMTSTPFGFSNEDFDMVGGKKHSYWHRLKSRFSGKVYQERKVEVESIVRSENPNIIFLDEFCATDFIIIYPLLKTYQKCIVLTPFLPSIPNSGTPPINSFTFPNNNVAEIWKAELKKQNNGIWKRKFKYFFRDNISINNQYLKQQKISNTYKISFYWEYIPVFNNLEKWYLQPAEIDFSPQKLPPLHRYIGPLIDINRKELIDERYKMFLKYASANKNAKIIFCSLGSVITQLEKDENVIISFFNRIAQVAQQNPNWYFALKIPPNIQEKVKLKSINIRVFIFPPYLDLLKKADIFITHCGGNSYLESVYMETPMLAVPPSDMWDYNGNAARIVYHQLGLKSTIYASADDYSALIHELLQNEKYNNAVKKMKNIFLEKYNEDYLKHLNLPN